MPRVKIGKKTLENVSKPEALKKSKKKSRHSIDYKINLRAEEALKKYFGYDEFQGSQKQIINKILHGEDVLAIMPTGAGKSLCYQLPALLFDGITLIITPINALMSNQCDSLNMTLKEQGITDVRATYINSEKTQKEIDRELYDTNRIAKLIYVSPERLFYDSFQQYVLSKKISMIVVDEAHCVSMWGYDFREKYSQIPDFYRNIHDRPIIAAFTATAVKRVVSDIKDMLHLNLPEGALITDEQRKKLHFKVINFDNKSTERSRKKQLLKDVDSHPGELGIIYCTTIIRVELIYDYLKEKGYKVAKYHGLKQEEQNAEQEPDWDSINKLNKEHIEVLRQFEDDEVDIVVATSAFGMGIDKRKGRDVTYVIHYDLPLNIENYYQEAGRGARMKDTERCDCILYNTKGAVDVIEKAFIQNMGRDSSDELRDYVQELARKRLEQLCLYTKSNDKAGFLEDYFKNFEPQLPDNPKAKLWHKRLMKTGPAYLYINNTHFARELRRGYVDSGVFSERLTSGEIVDNSYEIEGKDKLTFFDLMVMDAIYSIKRSGMSVFSSRTVLQVLAGYEAAPVRASIRKDIEDSIRKLQSTSLCYKSKKTKETAKRQRIVYLDNIVKEKFLCDMPLEKRKNGYFYVLEYKKDDDYYNKPFYYRNAEKSAKGQWLTIPLEDIDLKNENGKRLVPMTREWLEIEYYLLFRIMFLRKAGRNFNNAISFDTMIKELDIAEYVNSSGKVSQKRVFARIDEIMKAFIKEGYIVGYGYSKVQERDLNKRNRLYGYVDGTAGVFGGIVVQISD